MEMSRDEMLAMLAKLQSENNALVTKLASASRKQTISMKVTEKGGMSLYGLGRFPVTLYRSQWDALLTHADQIAAFLKANASLLASKD